MYGCLSRPCHTRDVANLAELVYSAIDVNASKKCKVIKVLGTYSSIACKVINAMVIQKENEKYVMRMLDDIKGVHVPNMETLSSPTWEQCH